jgi:hypothetical protein
LVSSLASAVTWPKRAPLGRRPDSLIGHASAALADCTRFRSASAFSASLSQRSSNARQLAATSGALAILARRAQSAAWSRQYFAYDNDITGFSHSYPNARPAHAWRQASDKQYLWPSGKTQE